MSVQKMWDDKQERFVWFDLSYFLGKKDTPDPRHEKPVKKNKKPSLPKKEEVK